MRKIRLGDLLLQQGAISQTQLQQAIAEQRQRGHKLGQVLIELGFIEEQALLNVLAEQLQLPFIDLS